MKRIVLDRRTLLVVAILVLILVVVSIYLASFHGSTGKRVERIGNFTVLDDPYKIAAGEAEPYEYAVRGVYNDLFDGFMKGEFINQCKSGSGDLLVIEYDKAILYVNCTLIKFRVDNSMIRGGEPVLMPELIPILVRGTRTYTPMGTEEGYVRVYHTKLRLTVHLPENVVQGLIINPDTYFKPATETIIAGSGVVVVAHHSGEHYSIANMPYLYFNASFLEGGKVTWYFVKAALSINGVTVTYPGYPGGYWSFFSNYNYSGVHPPVFAKYMSESEIMVYHSALKPLLEITGNRVVTIEWYIEVYVSSSGDFEIEFTFGTALRVVKKD